MKFAIFINKNAGSVQAKGQQQIEQLATEILGAQLDRIKFTDPSAMEAQIKEVMAAAGSNTHILISGGDGTIARIAPLFYKDKTAFGILPLGTMNLLARDLGIAPDLATALQQYKNCTRRQIDAGKINDRLFLCNAILGIVPEAAQAREKLRAAQSIASWSELATIILKGFDTKRNQKRMKLSWNGRRRHRKANALVIANNSYIAAPGSASDRLRRASLSDGHLAVYMARPAGLLAALRLLIRIVTGGWVKEPSIKYFTTPHLTVTLSEDKTLLALDGEVEEMETPLRCAIEPQALTVLVPDPPYKAGDNHAR